MKKRTIALVTGGLVFNGHTVYQKALGGSESALIYVARELASLNHDVTVYCRCDAPGLYDNVDYRTLDQYFNDEKSQFDIVIVSRYTEFLAMPLDSKMNILWCHDIDVGNFDHAAGVADRVFCLSEYHKSLYVDKYNIDPSSYVWTTTNGFDQSISIPEIPFNSKKNNYIYASRPERGLKLLLSDIWPQVLEQNPDAILHICGYNYNMGLPDDVKELYHEVDELLKTSKNIKFVGYLPKNEYYQLLSNCAFMLYPTDFPEISCINAIEAQNAGCLVITSNKYALSETVKSDTKITEQYDSTEYIQSFLNMVTRFNNEEIYVNEARKSKTLISEYSWRQVVLSWMNEIENMFTTRFEQYSGKIIDQLVYNSDIVAAWQLTGNLKYRQMLDKAEHDNLTISDFKPGDRDEDSLLNSRAIKLIDIINEKINNNPTHKLTILDLGSNDGILSLPIIKRFKDNIESLIMYDSSIGALDHIKSIFGDKYPQLKFINDNVTNLLSYNIKADVVIIGELLEHIEHTQSFLEFLMNLATSDTLFYFTVPHGPWESIAIDNTEINHVHHFELDDIKQIFKNVNISIAKSNDFAYGRRGEKCDNWMFWFTASDNDVIEFGQVDYQEKWFKTRPYKSISCCVITRDEEDNLSRCLRSVKPYVDEIVVVDTGSTDDTKYIAGKFTSKIYDLDWLESDGLGNFSRARNYAIDQATGDYILWIDADEQVENFHQLYKYIISDYYDGILLKQCQCLPQHLTNTNSDIMQDRLFKRDGIRFTGVIHEYPSRDDEHFLSKMFHQNYSWILHYGLANQQIVRQKSLQRNSDLIYKNARMYPNRLVAQHYIMDDCWNRFASSHPNPDLSLIDKAMNIWNNIKDCGDEWIISMSINVIQRFYSYCANNNIKFGGRSPQLSSFTNNQTNQSLSFYTLDPTNEVNLFLKYLGK